MGNTVMKNCLGLILAAFFILYGSVAQAGLKEGVDAYRSGNYAVALRELTPLAQGGDPRAQALLGEMHGSGSGVPQDHRTAAAWYLMAARQGNEDAQIAIGVMYERGIGVAQSDREASAWFHKAAEQGHGEAQYLLGAMYEYGRGALAVDLVQAYKWFSLAVATGFEIAQGNVSEVEAKMSRDQLEKAQAMAKEWLERRKPSAQGTH